MSGVTEDLIREITERVVRELLTVTGETAGVTDEEWPDYDEHPCLEVVEEPAEPVAETQVLVEDVESDTIEPDAAFGNVVPITVNVAPRAATESWLQREMDRYGYLNAPTPAHFIDAWGGAS